MLMERLFDNLDVQAEPFAVCVLATGWRLKLPAPDAVTLHFVLRGDCRLTTDTRGSVPMTTHTLAVVPSGVPHSLECGDRVEHEAMPSDGATSPCSLAQFAAGTDEGTQFRAACGRIQVTLGGSLGLFDLMKDAVVLDFDDDDGMTKIFADLIAEEQNRSPGSRAMIKALMNQCLVSIFRRLDEEAGGRIPWLSAVQDPRLGPAMDKVLSDPGLPHSLESLSRASGMSRSSFAERFAASTGRTPMDFVRETRIRAAGKLLRTTDLSVDGVADRVGFASRSHFSHAFRDYFQQTPSQFRAG
jgi:AraC-like DNA-binding protein